VPDLEMWGGLGPSLGGGPIFQLHISDIRTLKVHLMYLLRYNLLQNNILFKYKVEKI